MSDLAAPNGFVVSWPNCCWVFVGFLVFVPLISFIIMSVIETPVIQVFHYVFLPYISHDYLLKWHYDKKNGLLPDDGN
jgi:hypothetical protein